MRHFICFVDLLLFTQYIVSVGGLYLIRSGHTKRGFLMAKFLMWLVRDKSPTVVYSTAIGYVWGICSMHVQHGYDSPLNGVRDWSFFSGSLEVLYGVRSQPTKMVPWSLIIACAHYVFTRGMSDPAAVRSFFLLTLLLWTGARLESFLPDAFTGEGGFDSCKHLQLDDLRLDVMPYRVGIKGTKTDNKRARDAIDDTGREWKALPITETILNPVYWCGLYFRLFRHLHTGADSPVFVRDDGRPWLKRDALSDVRDLFTRADPSCDPALTLHGVRTLIWVISSNALGVDDAKRYMTYSPKSEACFLYNREFAAQRHTHGARMIAWATENSPAHFDVDVVPECGTHLEGGGSSISPEFSGDAASDTPEPTPAASRASRPRFQPLYSPDMEIITERRNAPKRSYMIYWVGQKRFQSRKLALEFITSTDAAQHDTSPGVQNAAMAPSPFAHSIMGCYQQFIAVDVAVPRKDHVANNTCLGVAAVDLHRLRKANIDLKRIRTIRGQLWTMAQKLSEEPECEQSQKLQDQYRAEMALELGLIFINGVADYAPELQEIQEQLSSTLYPNV